MNLPNNILSSRIIRGKPLAEKNTKQFYNDFISHNEIMGLPLVMCNTLQKRTCLSYVNGQPYLVFDTAVIEIFHSLHKAMILGCSDEFIRVVFYSMSSEQYFIEGQYALALQFAAKYLNEIEYVFDVISSDVEKDAPAPLFIQQVFLLSHEVFHYWLSLDQSRYKRAMDAKNKLLSNIFLYAQRGSESLLGESFKEALDNQALIEECVCDSMGAISAIDIGVKIRKQREAQAAAAIIEALNYQFILSCIESFNGQITTKISFSELNAFNFRLLHLKSYISRFLREDFGTASADEFERATQQSDYFINHTIQCIAKLYADESLALQGHFNDGDSISMDVRKQMLEIYSL